MAVRNNPDFRKIKTAMARDPEGTSRIPQETFQDVIDRMEHSTQTKTIEWPWIVEFFTKRGRPLTREEIKKLQEEDKRMQDQEKERQRQAEEADRRREARLMEELEAQNEEDNDDHEKRLEEDRKRRKEEEEFERKLNGDDDEEEYDDEYDEEYDDEEDFERYENASEDDAKFQRREKRKDRQSENLRSQSVYITDYVRGKSADSKKRGKYGVTVPVPFKFDTREAVKPKTIREKKVEAMIMEKQMEEQSMINH